MDRNVIITGSRGNLGRAVAQKFVAEGCQVIGTVAPGKLPEQSDGQVTYHEVNVLNAVEVDNWASGVLEKFGAVDSVVCLVGGFGMSAVLESDKEGMNRMIDLNFFSAFNVVKSCLSRAGKQGNPVNVILIGAKPAIEKDGSKGVFPYAISKSMLIKFAEAINADRDALNARATVIVPSIIDTPANRESMPDANFEDWVTPKSIAEKIYFACSAQGRDLRDTILKVYGNV